MPAPTLITDLSTTQASNYPSGSDNVFPSLDDTLRSLSGFLASIRDNSGNGWVSPYLPLAGGTVTGPATFSSTLALNGALSGTGLTTYLASPPAIGGTAAAAVSSTNLSYTGTLTGGTGVVNLGSGQFYKDASGNVGIGTASPGAKLDVVGTAAISGAVTLSGGTANGIGYLNGSKVLTTGSALTFDGTTLTASASSASTTGNFKSTNTGAQVFNLTASNDANTTLGLGVSGSAAGVFGMVGTGQPFFGTAASDLNIYNSNASGVIKFGLGTSFTEQMRLTSTGLGIGTASPGTKLQVLGTIAAQIGVDGSNATGIRIYGSGSDKRVDFAGADGLSNERISGIGTGGPGILAFSVNNSSAVMTERMRLDSSGNLGLGVTPSAWSGFSSVLQQRGGGHVVGDTGAFMQIGANNYYNGTNWIYTTTAPASRFTQNNGLFQWFNAPSGTAGNAISFTQAMTLDASGNLGVGTASPANKLTVYGSGGAAYIQVEDAAGVTGKIQARAATGLFEMGATSNHGIGLYTNNAERARITSGGNLLIGTTTDPGDNLYTPGSIRATTVKVDGGAYITGPGSDVLAMYAGSAERARIDSSGNLLNATTSSGLSNSNNVQLNGPFGYTTTNHISSSTSGTAYAYFAYNAGSIGSITQSGTTAVLYNTTSDQRLKTNIVDAPDASALIDSIKVRSYDWIADNSHQRYGMVAQELFEVAPEAVHAPADPDEMMAVDYSKLVPMLIKEIQSLRARVASLETQP